MVKVLIVEDEREKQAEIRAEVEGYFSDDVEFELCETFGDATRKIFEQTFDLIVIDLLVPRRPGEEPVDVSDEMIEHLSQSAKNRMTTVVAVTRFNAILKERQSAFTKAAIYLLPYDDEDAWKSCLRMCMQRVSFKRVYDFVIICALDEERAAFQRVNGVDLIYGEMFSKDGLDCRAMTIGGHEGVCVLLPRMGLVDSSIVAANALSAFAPKLICMSGICAGFEGVVELGSLLVSDISWEHQAGKWRGRKFEFRHYHEALENKVRTKISQMIEADPILASIRADLYSLPKPSEKAAVICPTVTGSAVIASTVHAKALQAQQLRRALRQK